MISIDSTEARAVSSLEASNEMTKHGITCVPVDYFHFGSFRYTNVTGRRDGWIAWPTSCPWLGLVETEPAQIKLIDKDIV